MLLAQFYGFYKNKMEEIADYDMKRLYIVNCTLELYIEEMESEENK